MHIIIKIIMFYLIFNSWEPTFWGAFLGAFFSFWFYVLGHYFPKIVNKIYLKFKTKKKMNELYRLLLLRGDPNTFFFDLTEIFTLESILDILKGTVLITRDQIQFESRSWSVLIKNKIFETCLSITDINSLMYHLDANNEEINIEVLFGFIQYLELRCKQEKIKLRISEELNRAKGILKNKKDRVSSMISQKN